MGQTVLRDNKGNITHVKIAHKTFLSVEDSKIFNSHQISDKDIQNHYGDDDRATLKSELKLIANNEYSIELLKFDIMVSSDLFNDNVLHEQY